MTRILGIDFSGASDAGKKIWIAEGKKTKGPLEILSCMPAGALPGSGTSAAVAIAALGRHIISDPDTIAGCDFPFALPISQMGGKSWGTFVAEFARRFPDSAAFYEICHREAEGIEIKRLTDVIHKTPFNSYNLRMHRQTWWGIAHLLHPLVAADAVVIRPQQRLRAGKPVLIEICPACKLKKLGCYISYKGKAPQHRRARGKILERLIDTKLLAAPSSALRTILLQNTGGDALDSVIAAVSASGADVGAKVSAVERLEGRVYV